jgi:hypothetical protein
LAAFPAALYITGFFQASELATMRHYAHAALQQARMWRERAGAAK